MGINKTDIDDTWEVSKTERTSRRHVQYKSDGYLFKEDRERDMIQRLYVKQAHADDDSIQAHNDTRVFGGVWLTYWPWSDTVSAIDDEIITEWEIEFRENGVAQARIQTIEVEEEDTVVKRYRPQKLEYTPK